MSLTRPLTRPLTRKISRAELTQGYGGSFSPLLLNPYLLFDARESMVGTLENPTLDLNPALPETLDVITATRSGTATYTDVNGNIATAAADTVRVDHVDGVPMILVEPSSENLVEYSEDFSDSSWDKQSGGTGVDPVVTPNSAISPDGTQNASKVVFNTAGGTTTSDESFLTVGLPTVIGGTYTQSVYLKGDVRGEQILIRGAGGSAYTTITLTTDWVRYEGTEVEPNNTDAYLQIGLRQGLSGVVINQSTTVYIWGAQFEEGSVATSYIPTSGSTVTRQADDLVISGSDFTDFFNNSEGTIYCEFEYDFEHAFEYVYNIRQDVNNEIRTQLTPTNDIRTRYTVADSHIAQPSPEGAVQGSLNRHAFSYKTNNFRGNVNGGNDEQDLSGNASLIPVEMQIGGRGNGISNIKFKRLIYWPYHSDSL